MSSEWVPIRVAQCRVGRESDVFATLGLGSCVAVVLHDAEAGIGGMAHVLLPEPGRRSPPVEPAKFARTAVPHLLEQMCAAGADRRRIRAVLVGGAAMFAALMTSASLNTGERNVAAARAALDTLGIPIRGEDVGGEHGRSVRFETGSGRISVSTVGRGHRDL